MAEATLNSLNAKLDTGNKIATETRDGINVLVENARAQMAMAEQNRYEDLAKEKTITKKSSSSSSATGALPDFDKLKTPLGLITAGITFAAGTIYGWFQQTFIIITKLAKVFVPIIKLFDKIKFPNVRLAIGTISSTIRTIVSSIIFLGKMFYDLTKELLVDIGRPVAKLLAKQLNFIVDPIRKFGAFMGSLVKSIIPTSKIITSFSGKGAQIFKMIGSLGRFFPFLGMAFSRILYPITAIYGVITGFMEGFKEGGILGGIEGAITKTFNLLVGAPIDLLINIGGWILGKLGFDESAQALKDFSFQQFFKDMIGGVFNYAKGAVDWVVGLFTGTKAEDNEPEGLSIKDIIFGGIGDMFSGALGLFGQFKDKVVNLIKNYDILGFVNTIVSGALNAITFPIRFLVNNIIELIASSIPNELFGFEIPGAEKARNVLRSFKLQEIDVGATIGAITGAGNTSGNQIAGAVGEREALAGAGAGNTTIVDASTNSTGGNTSLNMGDTSTEDKSNGRGMYEGMYGNPYLMGR